MISNAQASSAINGGDFNDTAKPPYVMIFVPGPVEYGEGVDESMEQATNVNDRVPEEPTEQTPHALLVRQGQPATPWYNHRYVWAAGGLFLGALALLTPRPTQPSISQKPPLPTASKISPPSNSAVTPPVEKKPTEDAKEPTTDGTNVPAVTPPATTPAGPSPDGTAPARPFMGSISGTLPTADTPMLPNIGSGSLGNEISPTAPTKAALIEISRPRTSSSKAEVVALAKKLGGASHSFTETDGHGNLKVEGVLLYIPPAKLDEAVASIGGSVDNRWTGSADTRADELLDSYKKRVDALEAKKHELLVKYLEDAPEVRDIQDTIDNLNKTMAQLHPDKGMKGMAWVVVSFQQ